jgi:hypothetical protein
MKKTLVVSAVVGLALVGTAAWATLPQVDPATVPIGQPRRQQQREHAAKDQG